jgi:hypothetical protein
LWRIRGHLLGEEANNERPDLEKGSLLTDLPRSRVGVDMKDEWSKGLLICTLEENTLIVGVEVPCAKKCQFHR